MAALTQNPSKPSIFASPRISLGDAQAPSILRRNRLPGYNRSMQGPAKRRRWAHKLGTDREMPVTEGSGDATFQWIYDPSGRGDEKHYSLVQRPASHSELVQTDASVASPTDAPHGPSLVSTLHPSDVTSPAPPRVEETGPPDIQPALPLRSEDAAIWYRLEIALERRRSHGELPTARLLTDGLSALSTGVCLASDQVSLLLSTALSYRRGMLTALRHMDDPSRTGMLVAEAMIFSSNPVTPDVVSDLMERDPTSGFWRPPMLAELRLTAANGAGRERQLAHAALARLQPGPGAGSGMLQSEPRPYRWYAAVLVLLAVIALALWFAVWWRTPPAMASVRPGEYAVLAANGETRLIATEGFSINIREVTNREFRACVQSGVCTPQRDGLIAGISGYSKEPRFDLYPALNASWETASAFCARQGMRLPTADEWMVAAGSAPLTGRPSAYPWGIEFDVQRANTLESDLPRPVAVGSFSPAGDSAVGASDMAGNAAEWTATLTDDRSIRVVKGGSYKHDSHMATVFAEHYVQPDVADDWIGFRCLNDRTPR